MLRKALWSASLAATGAVATLVATRAAAAIWRLATGEEPPAKR
jgi:hypothetical protein